MINRFLIFALVMVVFSATAQKKVKLSKADEHFLKEQMNGLYAKLETNRGDIYLELYHTLAPMTVANFVGLAEGTFTTTAKPSGTPYFDGLKFHRIIPGFMIQGGCPFGNGSGDPGYSFPDELDKQSEAAKAGYLRGVLAMANRGPNTNGSQFFIMHKEFALPYNYTIFGKVRKGIEFVDSIASVPRSQNDVPDIDQIIRRVIILRKGQEAAAFNAERVFESEKAKAKEKEIAKAREDEEAAKVRLAEVNAGAEKIISEKFSGAGITASGLRTMIERRGEGAPVKSGDKISLHCTGYLLNSGTKFWSSLDGAGAPLELSFAISPRLIPGMEEGIMMLGKGGKARFIIPPNLGYGPGGMPPAIPPDSWLIFDVEVLSVN